MRQPCIDCGELTSAGSRCDRCWERAKAVRTVYTGPSERRRERAKGYNWNWKQLSKKARRLQPFCSDCGSTRDLQCDHTPEAWDRHERGLPIRLEDVDVVCGRCNVKRGAARGPESKARRKREARDRRRLDAKRAVNDAKNDGRTLGG